MAESLLCLAALCLYMSLSVLAAGSLAGALSLLTLSAAFTYAAGALTERE